MAVPSNGAFVGYPLLADFRGRVTFDLGPQIASATGPANFSRPAQQRCARDRKLAPQVGGDAVTS